MRESSNTFESGQDTDSPIVEEYDDMQDEELYSDYNEESKYGSDEIPDVEYSGQKQKQQNNDEQQNISQEQPLQNNESQEKNDQDESTTSVSKILLHN